MEKSGRKRQALEKAGEKCVVPDKSKGSKPVVFAGDDEYMLDPSRRVTMPVRWRSKQHDEFWVLPWPLVKRDYLLVLPVARFEQMMAAVGQASLSDERSLAVARAISGRAQLLKLDKSSRVLLPEILTSAVGIKSSVKFVGMMGWFEIWDPKRHADTLVNNDLIAAQAVVGMQL